MAASAGAKLFDEKEPGQVVASSYLTSAVYYPALGNDLNLEQHTNM
jgi:hypothetical protein